jgi:ABC-type nitrate/sulfonate/bicarbonate transport system substrate-binding protein
MSWEPAITVQSANEDIDFDRAIDVREGLQAENAFGRDAWYLVWAVRENAYNDNTEAARGLIAACQQVGDLIENDLEAFLDVIERRTENPREPIREALETGTLAYEFTPVNDIQSDLNDQLEVFSEIGIVDEVPGDDFYGDVS